jgi:hypothetical protein
MTLINGENNMTDKKQSEVTDTSQGYDSCIGVRNTDEAPGTLAEFLGVSDSPTNEKEAWRELWVGMPQFNNKKARPELTLTINFRNEDDYQKFIEQVGFKTVTKKTKTIWFPEVPREENSLMRFIDDGEL